MSSYHGVPTLYVFLFWK